MCLIPNDFARIAQEDIEVYKVLLKSSEDSYFSPYRYEPYYMGELKTANIRYRLRTREGINYPIREWVIEEGLHAYTDKGMAMLTASRINTTTVVAKVIIPRGAMYILGQCYNIVSTQLKIVEICH